MTINYSVIVVLTVCSTATDFQQWNMIVTSVTFIFTTRHNHGVTIFDTPSLGMVPYNAGSDVKEPFQI